MTYRQPCDEAVSSTDPSVLLPPPPPPPHAVALSLRELSSVSAFFAPLLIFTLEGKWDRGVGRLHRTHGTIANTEGRHARAISHG